MTLEFKKAVRTSVPVLVSVSGPSGSGKTYTGILIAAGLCRPNGQVFMADTENGRGAMYADSPGIMKALPGGYGYVRMDPPFSPESYIEVIDAAEKQGKPGDVLLFDSFSHEWEGTDGCCDIAEKFKLKGMPNWSKAKIEHKKLLNRALFSTLHIVFCLRARDKVKITKDNKVIPLGIQPIAEKSFVFEMMVSLGLSEGTHFPTILKAPEALQSVFDPGRLVRREDGEAIRLWNEKGEVVTPEDQLLRRARMAAGAGMESYRKFVESLTAREQTTVKKSDNHADNKRLAEAFDAEVERAKTDPGMQLETQSDQSPLQGLLDKIIGMEKQLGAITFGLILSEFGKSSVASIQNELDAEDILFAMRKRLPTGKTAAA